jgi:signal transduction histidine kinase
MKLSEFITANMEEILVSWVAFARNIPTAGPMSTADLRDHAKQMLEACVADLDSPQSAAEQSAKSKGLAPGGGDERTAAARHGLLRLQSGYSVAQLISEFRALRATVVRLWLAWLQRVSEATTNDLVRFNETIDQALAESAVAYSDKADRTRETFLAILGHDLRTPLSTMALAGDYLTLPDVGTHQTAKLGVRVKKSAAVMASMVHDLLEYARTQLGDGIPVVKHEADAREICQSALDDSGAANPGCQFELSVTGDPRGWFDAARLQQVVTNLLNNAAQYRSKVDPVTILVDGAQDQWISIKVRNFGPVIPEESLEAIFDPLVRLARENPDGRQANINLGLGLFIAREITLAHGGTITAASNEHSGTLFSVRIPRSGPASDR